MERLSALALDHPLIGDVRGAGLFIGVELVRNSATLAPATEEASDLVNRAREMGVLLSTDGPFDNVIKIKPPLAFARREAEIMSDIIAAALTGLGGGT
jgi:4-aminobutyrate aminotransferase-like enzyme